MTYEYKCYKCNNVVTLFRSVKDRNEPVDCECGGKAQKIISIPNAEVGCLRDSCGERIWFPKDNRPYFDHALRRTFNTPKEKQSYLNKKGLVMDGSSMPNNLPLEAASMRDKSYRKSLRMED